MIIDRTPPAVPSCLARPVAEEDKRNGLARFIWATPLVKDKKESRETLFPHEGHVQTFNVLGVSIWKYTDLLHFGTPRWTLKIQSALID